MNKLTYMALVGLTAAKKPFSKCHTRSPFSDKIKAKMSPKRKLEHDEPAAMEWDYGMEDYGMEEWDMEGMDWEMEEWDMEGEGEWDEKNVSGEMEPWEVYLFPKDKDLADYFTTWPSLYMYMVDMKDNQMTMWLYISSVESQESCYLSVEVDPAMNYMPKEEVKVIPHPDGYDSCPSYIGTTLKYTNPDFEETGYLEVDGVTYFMNPWENMEPYFMAYYEEEYYGEEYYGEEWYGDEMEGDWKEDAWEEDWDKEMDDMEDYENYELYLFPEDMDLAKFFSTYPMHIIYSDSMTESSMSYWLEIMYDQDFTKYEYCYLTVYMEGNGMPKEDVYVTDAPDGDMGGLCPTYQGSVFKYENPNGVDTGYMTIGGTRYFMNTWEAVEPYYMTFEEDYCKTNPEDCKDGEADWEAWEEEEFGDMDDWYMDDMDWDYDYDYDYDYDMDMYGYYDSYYGEYFDGYYYGDVYSSDEPSMGSYLDVVVGWFSGDASNKLITAVASVVTVVAMY